MRVVTGTAICGPRTCRAAAELRAGTGDLRAEGVSGRCDSARRPATCTSRGRRPTVFARTSTGDIHVEAGKPGAIDAQADTGDIHISVPDQTYAVDAAHGHRRRDSRRAPDDASPRKLRAHTQTGDVHLEADG